MSSLPRATRRVDRKAQFIKTAQERTHRIRQSRVSHYVSERNSSTKGETETGNILEAGGKANEQRENTAANTESMPPVSTSSLILSSSLPFVTPLGLVSVPATMLPSASGSLLDASPLPQSTEQKRSVSESLASSQSTASASPPVSSRASSMHFPPALLAFILVFACLFCVMMFLAFRRMCCRKKSLVHLPSPQFLGHTPAGLGSDRERNDPMELNKPKVLSRNTMVRFAQDQSELPREESKAGSFKNAPYMPYDSARFSVHLDALNAPPAAHVPTATPSEPRRSRVLRPYVPRHYHRPHPAFTSDPDSVMPLIPRDGFNSTDDQRMRSKEKLGHSRIPEGKENFMPGISADSERPARSVHRPSRPLSILTKDVSNGVTGRQPKIHSSTSINLRQYEASNLHSATVKPLPQSGTVAVDIGLAMLSGFSSPIVGLGFDPHSMSSTELETDQDHIPAAPKTTGLSGGLLSQLTQSASSESDGLAYLASEFSRSSMARSMTDGYSVAQSGADIASALEREDDQEDHRAQAHARLVEQLNLAIDQDTHLPEPSVVRFNPPFLPTLSEMALSRADPLYESVTNELFASYGVRMSTASARMSRVSARISRMLSWFGDEAAPVERLSIGDGMSDEIEWMSEGDRMSGVALGGGVQPLRIGKLRTSSG